MTAQSRTLLALITLLLPLLVVGAWTGKLSYARAHAQNYHVIVEGYDPRDLLHGKYINLRYLWDDPASQKPADRKIEDLPYHGRFYVSEWDAADLETMLVDGKNVFSVDIALYGRDAQIKSLMIDEKPWEESLAAWRENRDNQSHD